LVCRYRLWPDAVAESTGKAHEHLPAANRTDQGVAMDTYKRTGRIFGVVILMALLTNALGSELAEAVLLGPNYLQDISANQNQVLLGELLELACGGAVIVAGIVAYPIFKQFSQRMALGYVGFRITEAAVQIAIVVPSLMLVTLSRQYVAASAPDGAFFHAIGSLFQEERQWAQLVYLIIFAFGDFLLYLMLLTSRLVPRFLSVWGLAGLAVLLAGCVANILGNDIDMAVYGVPLGLNELCLSVWLIVVGFANPRALRDARHEIAERADAS
jgi:Domain of unknown function (DUF4386)